MGNLKEIRHTIRIKRRQITGHERLKLSIEASERLLSWLDKQPDIEHIATFLSLPEEIDTTPLNNQLLKCGYSLYLPHVSERNQPLKWLFFDHSTPLEPDQAGILAPKISTQSASRLDIVITPLVAFDLKGTRLGMGGGFYDRSFQGKIPTQSPRLIGIAYPCQRLSILPRRNWDIPLDACAVADQFYTFSSQYLGEF